MDAAGVHPSTWSLKTQGSGQRLSLCNRLVRLPTIIGKVIPPFKKMIWLAVTKVSKDMLNHRETALTDAPSTVKQLEVKIF